MVSAPGPQPTSITRCPTATDAKSAKSGASGIEYLPMNRSYAPAPTVKLTGGIYALSVCRGPSLLTDLADDY